MTKEKGLRDLSSRACRWVRGWEACHAELDSASLRKPVSREILSQAQNAIAFWNGSGSSNGPTIESAIFPGMITRCATRAMSSIWTKMEASCLKSNRRGDLKWRTTSGN